MGFWNNTVCTMSTKMSRRSQAICQTRRRTNVYGTKALHEIRLHFIETLNTLARNTSKSQTYICSINFPETFRMNNSAGCARPVPYAVCGSYTNMYRVLYMCGIVSQIVNYNIQMTVRTMRGRSWWTNLRETFSFSHRLLSLCDGVPMIFFSLFVSLTSFLFHLWSAKWI